MNQPLQTTRTLILQRDVGPCKSCGAPIGHACKRPSCPQRSPVGQASPGPMPEIVRLNSCQAERNPLQIGLHDSFQGVNVDGERGWYMLYPHLAHARWRMTEPHLLLMNSKNGDRFKIEFK